MRLRQSLRRSPQRQMTTYRFEIEGEQDVRQALRKVEAELNDLKQANQDASQIVLAAARGRAPRRSGALAASGRATPQDRQASVSFSVPYANPIHWGWRARNIKPQPFAISAAEATQPVWLRKYEVNIVRILREVGLYG
jgi:hypothetical protein